MTKPIDRNVNVVKKIEKTYELVINTNQVTVESAVGLIVDLFHDLDREIFVSLHLDNDDNPIDFSLNHMGVLNSAQISPREIFKPALLTDAKKMILLHNHPSGSLDFSDADYKTHSFLTKLGELVGIEIINHYIFTPQKNIKSILEADEIKSEKIMPNNPTVTFAQFNKIESRQVNYEDRKFVIESPEDVNRYVVNERENEYKAHVLFLNNSHQVVGFKELSELKALENRLVKTELFKNAILANSAKMVFINEVHAKKTNMSDVESVLRWGAAFGIPVLDVIDRVEDGLSSLRNSSLDYEKIMLEPNEAYLYEESSKWKSLNLYDVKPEYIQYLKDKDIQKRGFSTVPDFGYEDRGRERKFASGPVFEIEGKHYFVFASHKTILNDDVTPIFFEREPNIIKGTLRYQYMLPVPSSALTHRNIHNEILPSRKAFLFQYLSSIRRSEHEIKQKAENVYNKRISGNIPEFLMDRFNDFKFLESKMIQYELNNKLGLYNENEIDVDYEEKSDSFVLVYEGSYRRKIEQEMLDDINIMAHIVEEDLEYLELIHENGLKLLQLEDEELEL